MPSGWPSLYAFFGPGGLLAQAYPAFEYRPSQLQMATLVESALNDRRHLLVEAGTGTGKTLAYLLPVLRSGRRVLLSTGTRNLQEQLVDKDVPLLARALRPEIGRDLDVVIMKGRQNYACRQKIHDLQDQPTLLALDELDYYQRIRGWVATTATGDQSELEFLRDGHPFWHRLNARRETCTGQKCPRYEDCFLTDLHRRAAAAELVVVNHHLFFADLALKRQDLPGVLPPYEAVVFDEAHELESVAGQYFGVTVTSHQVDELARDTLVTLRMQRLATPALESAAEHFRANLRRLLDVAAARPGRHPFLHRDRFLEEQAPVYDTAMQALAALRGSLDLLSPKPEEIHTLLHRCDDLTQRLNTLLRDSDDAPDGAMVFWTDRRHTGVHLQAAPIDVGARLAEVLFQPTDTVIMTSATLTVDAGFDYIRSRLGVDHARTEIVSSPFRYREQALLYLPDHLPPPAAADFTLRAAAEIEAILEASAGRAFVLCTSHEQMRLLHAAVEPRLPFPLLLQGQAPRNLLLERFRATPNAVLFATSSFWQGVDVQGEQLSCVIVDRLPFAVPDDPVVAARIRRLQRLGQNAFMEFQVPSAVLALKQGVGRLIRSRRDRGVVAILDHRILRKPYGVHFLRSLPDFACTTRADDVRRFFASGELPAHPFYAGPEVALADA